jgi:hypothetical protein
LSYPALLLSSICNLRFATPGTPRPLVRVRLRSGGHDYEGFSYASLERRERFAVLDLAAIRDSRVDAARAEAWVGSGATLSKLYYAVDATSAT